MNQEVVKKPEVRLRKTPADAGYFGGQPSPKNKAPVDTECQPEPWRRLVEVAGIEPASKRSTKIAPTSVVFLSCSFGLWRQLDPFHFSYSS
jgi:hypothetical protein